MTNQTQSTPPESPRRGFLAGAASLAIAGFVAIVPFGAGLATLLDPIFRKSQKGKMRKIAALDAVPDDGIPRAFPVVADRRDAWNYYPKQPVGSVYLRRLPGETKVVAFHSVCPHAGCFVEFNTEKDGGLFQCPCHNSDFEPNGKRINPEKCPSPRDLDTLEVDEKRLKQGEVWVEYKNFKAGHAEKEPIE